ncbi:hypothetical protein RHMOL_Rhmol07G0115600 [Rhododendron molle]|uniref:Uncharacterized protein n=1 Tax=Rhododendron molle TaxID=49168 RepID=A0ACC0N1J2_RHOML|nr:hypothetical protein RHMOL_Rhmol07G0115600 [Rhododendron molle]
MGRVQLDSDEEEEIVLSEAEVSKEVGRVVGSKIGELLEVDDRLEGGEQGPFIRVRVRLKVNTPLKRGGNIVCGGGRKVWVDYKYERIQSFCFYCGRVDHEENIRRRFHRTTAIASGDARFSDSYGNSGERGILTENKGGDWRDNQLVELGDNSVISLNGKSHRVGDLFPSESDVNKGNSYDLSKHGKENQGMQPPVNNGPGVNKKTIGLESGAQIEEGIMTQSKDGPVGDVFELEEVTLMDIPIRSSINIGTSSGTPQLIFSSKAEEIGKTRSGKAKSVKGSTAIGGGRGRGRKKGIEESPLVLGKRKTTGVRNPLTVHTLKGLCKLHSPGGVFLAETKNRRYKVEQVCRELGFSNFFVVDPEGTGGGLCFMWKRGITVCVIGSSNYWVDMEVRFEDGKLWRYTGIYASIDMREMRLIWDEVSNFRIQGDVPWVIMGDFNAIVSNEEKRGGNEKDDWELRDFQQFIRSNQLIDVGYVGYPFTWNNKRVGGDNIRIRLDRALASSKWRTDYPDVILRHLKARGSDHCPIILSKSAAEGFPKPRFIFDSRWVKERQCGEIVRRSWGQEIRGSRWFLIQRRLKICRQKLQAWRSRTQLNSRHTIKDLELQLDELEEETVFYGVSYKEKEGRYITVIREMEDEDSS